VTRTVWRTRCWPRIEAQTPAEDVREEIVDDLPRGVATVNDFEEDAEERDVAKRNKVEYGSTQKPYGPLRETRRVVPRGLHL